MNQQVQKASAMPAPRRIHEAYASWALRHPERVALTDAGCTIHYGELDGVVAALAQKLAAAGVRAGDRVLLVAENCVALALCILALSRLDAWSASVNARLSGREIDQFLEHSGARLALYFGASSADAQTHGTARGAQAVTWPGVGDILLGALRHDAVPEPVAPDAAQQVAALVYTSGTTGAPKAVMLTHANLLFIGANNRQLRHLTPDDVIYGVLPLSHVYGLSSLLVAALISGAALRLVPRFAPAALARALAQEGVTVMHGAPAMYTRLLEWSASSGTVLSAPQLRVAQSGGAPLTASLKAAFETIFGLVLHNGYGMTEAAPSICQTRMEAPRADCSVGPPIPGIEVRLLGAEHDPDGIGELCVRGPNVMPGYYRAPEASAEVLAADGWLRTGDLARREPDGAVFIVGRSKELIIRSGFNVYPVEIEQVLNAYPGIVHSAVVGRAVADNEEVVAFVEISEGAALDMEALFAYLRQNLSPYKIPAQVLPLEHLPAAATGKILKKELQRIAAAPVTTDHR
jgi:long-chain acyl-CoA synthetase